ncbi:hypothetical protein N825_21450 [Skermanella stibiiresistens SB22]|uniref:Major facilitator superfamily (MFS) profile domain-containing protein n=1 Tax=Skermanella stibiiresistens SB22 TaxID=1385369 RepID=W9GX22_9PROT|nr:hypothetical protein N825_21450 [Skermanella stibiiresistens SB22]
MEFQVFVRMPGGPDERRIQPAGEQARPQAHGLVLQRLDDDLRPAFPEIVERQGQRPSRGAVDRAAKPSAWASGTRVSSSRDAPSLVKATFRVVRVFSRVPKSSSRKRMCRPSAAGNMSRRRAARPKCGSSAAAAGIATINSIGNPGGFVGPSMIGWIKDTTGSFEGGLFFVAGLLVLSAVLTLPLARDQRDRDKLATPNTVGQH